MPRGHRHFLAPATMPLVLTPRTVTAGPLSVDLDGVLPDRLRGLSTTAVARLPIAADCRPCELGAVFTVTGTADDGRIECRGDFSRVHRVGAGMAGGRIDVSGDVGRHCGEAMSGGTISVTGSAGDWLACDMTDGEVHVLGCCGDNAAAALPGSRQGMRGGLVLVGGDAGSLAGARMRRGILAIRGGCGAAAAFEMLAGTVVVGGPVGRLPAAGMRRGSLVALAGPAGLPATFTRGAAWHPAFLPLLLRRLARTGFAAAAPAGPWRQWHGDLVAGGRGEVWCPEVA
ncbi:MAG: formylmethanofuran dehydrogenase subunit C [Planctomycetia bacterium]